MKKKSLLITIIIAFALFVRAPEAFATPGEGSGVVKICLSGQTWSTCSKDIFRQATGDIYIRRVDFGRPDVSKPDEWQNESNIYVKATRPNGGYVMSNWENNFVLATQRRSVSKRNDFVCASYSALIDGSPEKALSGLDSWCGFSSESKGYRLQSVFSPDFSLSKKYIDAGYAHSRGRWMIMDNQGAFVDRAVYDTRENGDRRVGDGRIVSNYHFMFVLDPPQATPVSPSPTVSQPTPTPTAVPLPITTGVLACPEEYPSPKDIFTPLAQLNIADPLQVNDPLIRPVGATSGPIILTSGNCSVSGTTITAGSEEGICSYMVTWNTSDPRYTKPSITCNASVPMKVRPKLTCTGPSGHAKSVFPGDSFEVVKGTATNADGKSTITVSPAKTCTYDAETNKISVSKDATGGESCTYQESWDGVVHAVPATINCESKFTVSAPVRTIKFQPELICSEGLTAQPGNLTLSFDRKINIMGPDRNGVYSADLGEQETLNLVGAKSGNDILDFAKTTKKTFDYSDTKDDSVHKIEVTTDIASICVPDVKSIKIKPIFGCANGKVMSETPQVTFSGSQPTSNSPDSRGYYSVTLTADDPTVTIASDLSGIALIPGDANSFNHTSAIAPYEYTVRFASTNTNVCGVAPVRSTCRADKCTGADIAPIINTPHTISEDRRKDLPRDADHPLHLQPFLESGQTDASYARSFTLTYAGKIGEQLGNNKLYIKYLLDCLSDDGTITEASQVTLMPCRDKTGSAVLTPYQDMTLGLGAVCSEWRLSIRYSSDAQDLSRMQDFTKQSPNDTSLIIRTVKRDEARCAQCNSFRCIPVAGDGPDSCSADSSCFVDLKPQIDFDLPTDYCEYEPQKLVIQGTITIPEGTTSRLKLGYKVIAPDNLRTSEIITTYTRDVKNGDPFSFEINWPGIRSIDTMVDVRLSGYLYDVDTGLPQLTAPTNYHLRWEPSTDCPRPEASVPSLTHRKKVTNIYLEQGSDDRYIISYTGYVLNDGNVPIESIRLEEYIKTAQVEVIYILATHPAMTVGSQTIFDSDLLEPGQAIGYTAVVRVRASEMNQICTEQISTGVYKGTSVSPDPSATCANIISSTEHPPILSAQDKQPILVASRDASDVQGATDTVGSKSSTNMSLRTIIIFTLALGLLISAVAIEESRLHLQKSEVLDES